LTPCASPTADEIPDTDNVRDTDGSVPPPLSNINHNTKHEDDEDEALTVVLKDNPPLLLRIRSLSKLL
jgi:hypothetical protein